MHILLHSAKCTFLDHFNRISFFHDFGDEKCQKFFFTFFDASNRDFHFSSRLQSFGKNNFFIFLSLSDPDDLLEHSTGFPVNFGHFTSFL